MAVHYNLSLEKQTYYVKAKRILVVSPSRTSDSLLLKYTLKNWFKDMILEIDVLNLVQLDQQKLQRYDVIFTTIKDTDKLPFEAIQINYFLNEEDYIKIRKALYSNHERNVLLNYFEKRLFISELVADNKEEVIKEPTSIVERYKQIDSDLYESVMEREGYGFTSFGNYVALPHPNDLIVNETFVASAILDKPIQWGA